MSLAPDGRLLISTIGTVNAPGVVAQDEDVIVFTGALGENASGVWSLYFDGSAAGLTTGSEDVTGIWVDGATQIPVTTMTSLSVTQPRRAMPPPASVSAQV